MKAFNWVQLGVELLMLVLVVVALGTMLISRTNLEPISFRSTPGRVNHVLINPEFSRIDFSQSIPVESKIAFDDSELFRV